MTNYNIESFILGVATSCLITAICLGNISLIIWEAILTAVIIGCIVIKYNRSKKNKIRSRR